MACLIDREKKVVYVWLNNIHFLENYVKHLLY